MKASESMRPPEPGRASDWEGRRDAMAEGGAAGGRLAPFVLGNVTLMCWPNPREACEAARCKGGCGDGGKGAGRDSLGSSVCTV